MDSIKNIRKEADNLAQMGLLSPPGVRENLLKEAERLREIAREMEAEDAGFEQSAM